MIQFLNECIEFKVIDVVLAIVNSHHCLFLCGCNSWVMEHFIFALSVCLCKCECVPKACEHQLWKFRQITTLV